MWIEYNPNPFEQRTGDCSVRAITKAINIDWDSAYAIMAVKGYDLKRMPSTDSVWGSVLKDNGFRKMVIPDNCCYTAEDFCIDYPKGTYVLGFGGHVATVENGNLFDAWNSLKEVPQFVWYKE